MAAELVLSAAQVGRKYGTEMFQVPCKTYGAQN